MSLLAATRRGTCFDDGMKGPAELVAALPADVVVRARESIELPSALVLARVAGHVAVGSAVLAVLFNAASDHGHVTAVALGAVPVVAIVILALRATPGVGPGIDLSPSRNWAKRLVPDTAGLVVAVLVVGRTGWFAGLLLGLATFFVIGTAIGPAIRLIRPARARLALRRVRSHGTPRATRDAEDDAVAWVALNAIEPVPDLPLSRWLETLPPAAVAALELLPAEPSTGSWRSSVTGTSPGLARTLPDGGRLLAQPLLGSFRGSVRLALPDGTQLATGPVRGLFRRQHGWNRHGDTVICTQLAAGPTYRVTVPWGKSGIHDVILTGAPSIPVPICTSRDRGVRLDQFAFRLGYGEPAPGAPAVELLVPALFPLSAVGNPDGSPFEPDPVWGLRLVLAEQAGLVLEPDAGLAPGPGARITDPASGISVSVHTIPISAYGGEPKLATLIRCDDQGFAGALDPRARRTADVILALLSRRSERLDEWFRLPKSPAPREIRSS